ncbi:hypothetical protein GUJ93_ZPchr0006g44356 [Zizania palustris]|uniref:Uncharacterized protein n=1 Tax=Zizania palustris TaxID=103762 RepID=A0A8J5SV61_ZIZPA|nr:hypothetical protein GUJ93_ZPchr0006g44356 [Zizania palustris]
MTRDGGGGMASGWWGSVGSEADTRPRDASDQREKHGGPKTTLGLRIHTSIHGLAPPKPPRFADMPLTP